MQIDVRVTNLSSHDDEYVSSMKEVEFLDEMADSQRIFLIKLLAFTQ
jgi:hypothetical protein